MLVSQTEMHGLKRIEDDKGFSTMSNRTDFKRNSLLIELSHLMTIYVIKSYWKRVGNFLSKLSCKQGHYLPSDTCIKTMYMPAMS